jgi:hypothetical protein
MGGDGDDGQHQGVGGHLGSVEEAFNYVHAIIRNRSVLNLQEVFHFVDKENRVVIIPIWDSLSVPNRLIHKLTEESWLDSPSPYGLFRCQARNVALYGKIVKNEMGLEEYKIGLLENPPLEALAELIVRHGLSQGGL